MRRSWRNSRQPPPERPESSGQSNITLPQGVSVHWQPDKRIIDSKNVLDHGTQASFQLLADHGKRACMITARATLDGPPTVQDGKDLRYWTREDGPQREWILNSLRRQIEEFLPKREA